MNFEALVPAAASRAVNVALTLRDWLIGAYSHEYELQGQGRSQHGETLMTRLAERLQHLNVLRSERELRRYRRLHLAYPQIRDSVSPELAGRLLPPEKRETASPESDLEAALIEKLQRYLYGQRRQLETGPA